jgi:hypothetical protein
LERSGEGEGELTVVEGEDNITECPKTPSTGKSDFSKFNRQTCSDMIVGTKKKIASSTGRFNQSLTILDDTDIADESSALL